MTAIVLVVVAKAAYSEPALTIYNQNFAVVRDAIDMDLKKGTNKVQFQDITAHLEPDSVMLRDPALQNKFRILEQNYRAEPVSQQLLLSFARTASLYIRGQGNIVSRRLERDQREDHTQRLCPPLVGYGTVRRGL